ncbi:MAG: YlqD family protein [Caldisericaceae bacterium]|jgi:hypothetical protein|nr:YlqD family protein [Caldisericaceae bacterium]
MSVLHLRQNVIVKVIVTEKFKQDYKAELEKQLTAAENKAKELKSSLAKLVIGSAGMKDAAYVESLKARIEEERLMQEALAQDIRSRISEIDKLKEGDIFPYTVLEGLVDVKEGDDLFKKTSGAEVVIKDGIVVSIKEE